MKPKKAAAPDKVVKPTARARQAPAPVTDKGEAPSGTVRLRDFIDAVSARAGARKAAAKPLIDATLQVLAEALDRGDALVLPPLGRVRVARSKDGAKGAALTLKLKRSGPAKAKGATDAPLAEADEQG